MTGVRVAILGRTGKNFAAGMSGGIAYVLDESHDLYLRLNKEMVTMSSLVEKHDILELEDMLRNHVKETNSPLGKKILDNFEAYIPNFKKVIPNDYSKMLIAIAQMEEKGMTREQADIEAFYAVQK